MGDITIKNNKPIDILKIATDHRGRRVHVEEGQKISFGNTIEGLGRIKVFVDGELVGYEYLRDVEDIIKQVKSFDSGGYTGDWGPEGKLAMLHQKELVLNQQDTSNLLAAVDMLRIILNTIDIHALNSQLGGILTSPSFHHDANNVLEQNVKIEASFPGMTNRYELEEAFNNLINKAS
jgi:hypothetical protein